MKFSSNLLQEANERIISQVGINVTPNWILWVKDRQEKERHKAKLHRFIPPLLTLLEYFAKVLVVAGAVPPAGPELILALPDAQPGSFGHLTDNLRLSLAQLSLLPRQTLRLSADTVGIHHQRTAHCPTRV